MDRKSYYFFLILVGLFIASVVATYYRTVVARNFPVIETRPGE